MDRKSARRREEVYEKIRRRGSKGRGERRKGKERRRKSGGDERAA